MGGGITEREGVDHCVEKGVRVTHRSWLDPQEQHAGPALLRDLCLVPDPAKLEPEVRVGVDILDQLNHRGRVVRIV